MTRRSDPYRPAIEARTAVLRERGTLTEADDAYWRELARQLRPLADDGSSDDALRRLLWLRHGCGVSALYGDDGEMQCARCGIDFRRDAVARIEDRFQHRALAAAVAQLGSRVAWWRRLRLAWSEFSRVLWPKRSPR
jgi:hypothetical protein